MRTQDARILIRVDASKPHLTGRSLYAARVIDDDNQSDSLERQHSRTPADELAIQPSGWAS